MEINYMTLWALLGYLVFVHLVVFLLIRAVRNARKRINHLEERD